jgi:hypothetical protein
MTTVAVLVPHINTDEGGACRHRLGHAQEAAALGREQGRRGRAASAMHGGVRLVIHGLGGEKSWGYLYL